MATEKQINFMKKLAGERVATNQRGEVDPEGRTVADILALAFPDGVEAYWTAMAAKPVNEVSEKIDRLLAAPMAAPKPSAGQHTLPADGPKVADGYYAIESDSGVNDLQFYRVSTKTEGRWAGYTFVDQVVGGHPDFPVKGGAGRDVMRRISEAGEADAARRYGQEIGRCSRCNRHLTDEESRAWGMGPDCRAKVGLDGPAPARRPSAQERSDYFDATASMDPEELAAFEEATGTRHEDYVG